MFQLLSTANPKIQKGVDWGYLSFILHLAPADLSGREVCPKRTPGCSASCLNTAGRGGMFRKGETTNVIQEARKRKTRLFWENRAGFLSILADDIRRAQRMADRLGLIPVFRLNGTSDLAWERYEVQEGRNIFETFPNLQFYDYTKMLNRKVHGLKNYHLTFSAAESNHSDVDRAMAQGMNVAVVFDRIPDSYMGRPVINADLHDLRFLDPQGVICGLKAKGRAKRDTTGFVRRVIDIVTV